MPSIIWCGRAPYRVELQPSEVVEQIEGARDKFAMLFFDLASQVAKPDGKQVALAVASISAVELSE